VLQAPWAIAISAAARGSDLERVVSDTIADWHRTGFLIRMERAHGIQPSAFLQQTSALWRRTRADGSHLCQRLPNGQWPEECRNQALIASTDASGLLRLGLLLRERTDIDLSFVYDRYDRTTFLNGIATTLVLVVSCIVGGFAVGIAGALLIARRIPLLSNGVRGLLTFSRMTPPLLQMYMLFFGVGAVLGTQYGIVLDALFVGVLCLSLYAGAANAYALMDAAELLFARIPGFRLSIATLPRALRLAKGPIAASLVDAVKATGMASAIAVPEIISASTAIMAEDNNETVLMNLLMFVYFLLVLAVIRALDALQRRYASD
jgi:polar amino acid transport system substrate-binding protein